MKTIFIFSFLLIATLSLKAKTIGKDGEPGFILGVSTYYYSLTSNSGSSSTKSTNSIYDIKGGYANSKGLYLGGIYTSRNDDIAGTSSTSGSELGASAGYFGRSGFHFVGHYIFSATLGSSVGGYEEGSGLQAEFGYLTDASSTFFIGVDLSYRSLTYRKQAGISLVNNYTQTELFPQLSFAFTFL